MFENIKKWFSSAPAPAPEPVPETKKAPKKKELSPKEKATAAGEPYVAILSVDLDPNDINNGAFELDWNELFIAKLLQAGYKGTNEEQIVDQWFTDVCRNIVLETFEQEQADPDKRNMINRRDLGGGRSEFS